MKLLFPKQNYNVLSPAVPTLIYLWEIYIFPGSVCLFCCRKSVDLSWEYINRSQMHECENWDWGRAIPRKGIHKWDFPCSVRSMLPPLQRVVSKVFCLFFAAMRTSSWPGLSSRTPGRCTRSACTPAPRPRSASTPRSPRTSSPPLSDPWIAICSSSWASWSQRSSAQPSSPSPSTMSSIRFDNFYCTSLFLIMHPSHWFYKPSVCSFVYWERLSGPGIEIQGLLTRNPTIRSTVSILTSIRLICTILRSLGALTPRILYWTFVDYLTVFFALFSF